MTGRYDAAIAAIDAANAADPNLVDVDGEQRPKEVVHAEMMTEWVRRLDPDATEAQLLAARAHHLRRWVMPRSEYPDGRSGYLRWRRDQGIRQADEIGAILAAVGYDDEEIEAVCALVRKRGDDETAAQVHEDALCLVFVQMQLDDLLDQLGADHAARVLEKTAAKMSPSARATAIEVASERGAAALRAI